MITLFCALLELWNKKNRNNVNLFQIPKAKNGDV